MIDFKYIKQVSILLLFSGVIISSGCNNYQGEALEVSEVNLSGNKKIINVFNDDADYVFNKLIDKEIYSTYNADRLIFQVKVEDLSTLEYLESINSRLKDKGWYFKEKFQDSYIYCNADFNQLEIIPPLDLNYSYSAGEGQTIKQLVGVWNISFTHSIHKRYICSKIKND